MDTIHYLTSIINLLKKTPEVREIIDGKGLGQELTFGQIGLTDTEALLKLHYILNSVKDAEITPIREHETEHYKQYNFRLISPVQLEFFHCEEVSQ